MGAPSFEFQSHSTYSDGELSPAAVVRAAAAAGVELLALTDHDTTDGVTEAAEQARRLGLDFVTGVEISALDPGAQDLHICGYLIDPASAALGEQLRRSRADREDRSERMATALTELGWTIDREQLETRKAAGQTIGRPHLAQAVVSHPRNATRLASEQLGDPSAFLVAYLIEGRPGFRERLAPTVTEAIDLIHAAGGVAVWAHPFWDIDAGPEVLSTLDRFVAGGLDGVEAFYVTHTQAQTELLVDRCAELGLLTTGSSDFHGPDHRQFNHFRAFETYGHTPTLGRLARGRLISEPDHSLRRANQTEALAVAELLLRSRHATPGIPPGPHSDDKLREWFREVCFKSREVWVATDGDALRAMMVLNADWIEQLFVEPGYLHQGYGSRLLAHAQSIRSELLLWCFQANTPARAFYEAHGFRSAAQPSADNEEQTASIKYRWTQG